MHFKKKKISDNEKECFMLTINLMRNDISDLKKVVEDLDELSEKLQTLRPTDMKRYVMACMEVKKRASAIANTAKGFRDVATGNVDLY